MCWIVANPISAVDFLAWLQSLIDLEEVLDFVQLIMRNIGKILQSIFANVSSSNAEKFVVATLFICHTEHSDNATGNNATRKCWLIQHHQCIKRIAVVGKSVLDETVVVRKTSRSEKHAIKTNLASVVIDLVLVAASRRDFDDHIENHWLGQKVPRSGN